jgi:hypothetical protein
MDTQNGGMFEDADPEEGDAVTDETVEVVLGPFSGPRCWSWRDTAGIGVGFMSNVCEVAADTFALLAAQIGAHDAYRRNGADFASSVLSDVKSL